MAPPKDAPSVTIVQPLCGVEAFSRETLRSIFALDYPSYEVIFCLASGDDPIAPLVRGAIAANPDRPARLLIGDDRISANPKLNNVVKGWKAARHDWVIIADSNVLMPSDYIQRLLARWRSDSGIVCAPPIGSRPETFAAEIECAFLNTYEARWQYAGESSGYGFAQGKTMLWRRETLEAGGGIEALGAEIAEDAAATKLINAQGFSAHLVDRPFQQPLGRRRLRDVWSRQLRWARLRRATFPLFFAPEIVTTSLFTLAAAAVAAPALGVNAALAVAVAAVFWYSGEAVLAYAAGWPLSWRSPAAWLARDILLPFLWARGWSGDNVVWRGNAMNVEDTMFGEAESEPRPQI
jgi:ceramide glucosyltransferase